MVYAHPTPGMARQIEAPALVPSDFVDVLRDADALLALMGSEELSVVADLADALNASAIGAGASQIAEAASAVKRIASGHRPVALTGAMRDLTEAIARAQHEYHLES